VHSADTALGVGKRTLTEQLEPVQRRAIPGVPGPPAELSWPIHRDQT
jgi:hypothetical protein